MFSAQFKKTEGIFVQAPTASISASSTLLAEGKILLSRSSSLGFHWLSASSFKHACPSKDHKVQEVVTLLTPWKALKNQPRANANGTAIPTQFQLQVSLLAWICTCCLTIKASSTFWCSHLTVPAHTHKHPQTKKYKRV